MNNIENGIKDVDDTIGELKKNLIEIESAINEYEDTATILIQYVKGGLQANGASNTATNRVRHSIRYAEYDLIVFCDPSKEYRVALYNAANVSNNTFVRFIGDNFTNATTVIPNGYYYVILGRNTETPSAEITDTRSFASAIKVTKIFYNTEILKGKKLSLLGDSISAYKGYTPINYPYYYGDNDFVQTPDEMWWSVLCRECGLEPLVINAYSGSGVTQLEDTDHVNRIPMSSDERCSGLNNGSVEPDIIIIAGGINDYSYSMSAQSEPLAWDGKTVPVITNSFTEAYACMVKKLQTNYPNAIIIALSTWFTCRGTYNGYTLTHISSGNAYTQTDYNNAIKNVAEQMHIQYLDVSNIGFSKDNYYPTFAKDSNTIPTHPNKFGQFVMGKYIANNIVSKVMPYFYGKFSMC